MTKAQQVELVFHLLGQTRHFGPRRIDHLSALVEDERLEFAMALMRQLPDDEKTMVESRFNLAVDFRRATHTAPGHVAS